VRNTLDAIDRLKGLGAEVVEVKMDFPKGVERAYYAHMDPMFFASTADKIENMLISCAITTSVLLRMRWSGYGM
jgi:hypothetical protein